VEDRTNGKRMLSFTKIQAVFCDEQKPDAKPCKVFPTEAPTSMPTTMPTTMTTEESSVDLPPPGCTSPRNIDFTVQDVACQKELLDLGEECEPQCWEGYTATRRPVCLGHGALAQYQCLKYDCGFEEEPSSSGYYCGLIKRHSAAHHDGFVVAPSTRFPTIEGFMVASYIPSRLQEARMETVVAPYYRIDFSYIMDGTDTSLEVISLNPRNRSLSSTMWSSTAWSGGVEKADNDGPWRTVSVSELTAGFVTDECSNTVIQFVARGNGYVAVDSVKFSISDGACEPGE